jgi:uncharacterized membrane protein
MSKFSESKIMDWLDFIVRILISIIVLLGGIFGFMPVQSAKFPGYVPEETCLMVESDDGGVQENFRHRNFKITIDSDKQQNETAIFVQDTVDNVMERINFHRGFFMKLMGSEEPKKVYFFSHKSQLVITDGPCVYFISLKSQNQESAMGKLTYYSNSEGRHFEIDTVGASGLNIEKLKKSCTVLENQKIDICPQGIFGSGRLYSFIYNSIAGLGAYGWMFTPMVMFAIFSPLLVLYIVRMLRVRRAKREIQYVKNDPTMKPKQKKDRIQAITQENTGMVNMFLQNIGILFYYLDSNFGSTWCASLFKKSFLWSKSIALAPCTSALWKNRFIQPTITGIFGVMIISGIFQIQQRNLEVSKNEMHWVIKIISILAIYSWCNGSSIATVFSVIVFSGLWNLIAWVSVLITERINK